MMNGIKPNTNMNIRIVSTPRGQAPEWVRNEWVGLVLPVADQSAKGVQAGALGGRPENQGGYPVNTTVALEALESKSPEAATWWKSNLPLARCPQLVFGREFCEVVE